MRFEKPRCPKCGALAKGTLETIPGVALLRCDAQGQNAEHTGQTDMDWDNQETVRHDGVVTLVCGCGQEWQTDVDYGEEEEQSRCLTK
jgi:hypothetical protein